MLAQTDLDLDGRQLQLPFSSFCLTYTDRQTLGIAERLRATDPGYFETPRLLRILTAYVAAPPAVDEAWRLRIAFAMDALDGQWPYLVVRDLWVQPYARLDAILDSHVPEQDLSALEPLFESARLRELVHLVINSIMYTVSAGAESQRRAPSPGGSRESRGGQDEVPATDQEILFLPGPIRISEERQVHQLQHSPGGGALLKRFMVRGHWRRAAANWKDKRPRWIRPYWKGPDIATILERQYRLTT